MPDRHDWASVTSTSYPSKYELKMFIIVISCTRLSERGLETGALYLRRLTKLALASFNRSLKWATSGTMLPSKTASTYSSNSL